MGSLAKTYSQEKLLGQIYTPTFIIEKILDDMDYHSRAEILGKPLLDPACGNGRFLIEAAKRVIAISPKKDMAKNLEQLYGWDIDGVAVEECIENMNHLIEPLNIKVNWNIFELDSLHYIEHPEEIRFDFIVGNPPYIRIQHLDETQRKYIQTHYSFCKSGSTDIYMAFFELCHKLLTPMGVCGLITPNTYFYTQTAQAMRDAFAHLKNIRQITNYGKIQVFQNATTYSAITIFTKKIYSPQHQFFLYQQAIDKDAFQEREVAIEEITDKAIWQLSATRKLNTEGVKLGDICQIHTGLATLMDKAYVFPVEPLDDTYVWADTKFKGRVKIEKAVLKPIIKASTFKKGDAITDYILFPYKLETTEENGQVVNKHVIMPEKELAGNYPEAFAYLLTIKNELDKRDNGKPNAVAWYAFGRSQGLDNSFGEKVIFSPMNKKPNFIHITDPNTTYYSGYCIKYQGDYQKLLPQLNSKAMEEFIEVSARDFRGGWKAYSKKVLQQFVVDAQGL
jgi:tRNA1(Val) A37 N6-methylase TrmN6